MTIQKNVSIKNYHTFGLNSKVSRLFLVEQLQTFIDHYKKFDGRKLILGGGANSVFLNDIEACVYLNRLGGIEIVKETKEKTWVNVASGVSWQTLVEWCLEHNFYGIENLTDIPGSVGAAPIQNIGAYGVEVCSVIEEVSGVNLKTFEAFKLSSTDLNFKYRHSIFKEEQGQDLFVTDVLFCFSQNQELVTHYKGVEEKLLKCEEDKKKWTAKLLKKCISSIRQSKLPNPEEIGNSGSFFKNPILTEEQAGLLKIKYDSIPLYKMQEGVKTSAAWLIDQCGLKGFEVGGAAVHQNHALVLTNKNQASGDDLKQLKNTLQQKVFETFGVNIEPEVNLIS